MKAIETSNPELSSSSHILYYLDSSWKSRVSDKRSCTSGYRCWIRSGTILNPGLYNHKKHEAWRDTILHELFSARLISGQVLAEAPCFALPRHAPCCMFHSKHHHHGSHYLCRRPDYVSFDHSTFPVPANRGALSRALRRGRYPTLHRRFGHLSPIHIATCLPSHPACVGVIDPRPLAWAQRHFLNPTVRRVPNPGPVHAHPPISLPSFFIIFLLTFTPHTTSTTKFFFVKLRLPQFNIPQPSSCSPFF